MTNVLFITSSFSDLGGAEKNIIDLIRGLNETGFSCQLAVLQSGPLLDEFRLTGVTVRDIGLRKILGFKGLWEGVKLFFYMRREKIGAVITYHHDADIWGGLVAYAARVPIVISSRRDMGYLLTKKHQWAYKLVNRLFTHIISVSNAVKEEVMKREGISSQKITTIYNGVDFQNRPVPINRFEKRRLLGLRPEDPIVGSIASFRPIKGQEYFVRAAAHVLRSQPNVQFVIVGNKNSEYYEKVKKLISDLGIEKNVHCLGERKDISDLLPVFDVFVLSSLQEGFSNALIEAMAWGVPVAASSVGGNKEAIRAEETGLLVGSGDVEGFAESILRLINDQKLRRDIVSRARHEVFKRFSFDRMIDSTSHLLTRLYLSRKGWA